MKKTQKIKHQFPIPFDWESPDFLKISLELLEEADAYDLFKEGGTRPRLFREELQAWIDKWKPYH